MTKQWFYQLRKELENWDWSKEKKPSRIQLGRNFEAFFLEEVSLLRKDFVEVSS